MSRYLVRCFSLVLALSGCNSTGVGNPPVASQSLSMTDDPEVEPSADPAESTEQLDAARLRHAVLVIGELRFVACDPAAEDAVVTGPILIDLVQHRVEPKIEDVPIPFGGFCGIDATLGPATQPPALAGRSLLFSGARSDGTLFLLFADMPGTLRMRPPEGVRWPTDGKHRWLWALRPKRWLLPSDIENSDSEPLDGIGNVIAIDVNRHPALYTVIRKRIAKRSTLHVDRNDNGELDPDEKSGDALIGEGLESID